MQEINQQKFVNVDMTSTEGLERAKALNLASSKVPDIVISDMLQGTLEVFNNRKFSFEHPSYLSTHLTTTFFMRDTIVIKAIELVYSQFSDTHWREQYLNITQI